MVLAGDHLQLPPTIKSLNSKSKSKSKDTEGIIKGMTLEKTLFDRLLGLHGPEIKVSFASCKHEIIYYWKHLTIIQ